MSRDHALYIREYHETINIEDTYIVFQKAHLTRYRMEEIENCIIEYF